MVTAPCEETHLQVTRQHSPSPCSQVCYGSSDSPLDAITIFLLQALSAIVMCHLILGTSSEEYSIA